MAHKKNNKFQISTHCNRIFSEDFKKQKVKDILEKRIKIREVSLLYGVSRASVYRWLYLYSNLEQGTKIVLQMESEQFKTQTLMEQVANLERKLGQKQMQIDYFEKAFELLSDHYGQDLKKKLEQLRSNGSESMEKTSRTK